MKDPTPLRKIGGSDIGYYEDVYQIQSIARDTFLKWHPDFSDYTRNVSAYMFAANQNATLSFSISLPIYGDITASANYNAKQGSGTLVWADSAQWSRPAVYGDVYRVVYLCGYKYNSTGKWTSSGYQEKICYNTSYTYNRILYK